MKTHLYLDGAKETRDGYCRTACGKDGYKVGGLIPTFFKMVKVSDRCKKCDKLFKG